MRPAAVLVGLCLLPLTASLPTQAAQDNAPPEVAVVRPTEDSFDELIQAGSLFTDSGHLLPGAQPVDDAVRVNATLTQKRAAFRGPVLRQALAALRDALGKPLERPTLREAQEMLRVELSTPLEQWGTVPTARELDGVSLFNLGRMLAVEQYVLLSDGKVSAAIDSFADSLALSDAVKRWDVSGVGSGQLVESFAVRQMAQHLDQLSEDDCNRLFALLKTNLGASDPAIIGIRSEAITSKVMFIARMTALAGSKDESEDEDEDNPASDPNVVAERDFRTILHMAKEDPAAWAEFETAFGQSLTALDDAMAEGLSQYPVPQPTLVRIVQASAPEADRLGEKFARSTYPSIDGEDGNAEQIIDREIAWRTRLQLLAVHADILRWRWEHGVVPDSLDVLKLGPLANDPFSSTTLLYTRLDDTRCTLASVGPLKRDENGSVLPGGKRATLMLNRYSQ